MASARWARTRLSKASEPRDDGVVQRQLDGGQPADQSLHRMGELVQALAGELHLKFAKRDRSVGSSRDVERLCECDGVHVRGPPWLTAHMLVDTHPRAHP